MRPNSSKSSRQLSAKQHDAPLVARRLQGSRNRSLTVVLVALALVGTLRGSAIAQATLAMDRVGIRSSGATGNIAFNPVTNRLYAFGQSADASRSVRRVIEAARKLIPHAQAYEIVLIDPELAGDPDAVRRLDAFTVREADGHLRQKVYVNGESQIVQQAMRGVDFYVKVLAAVIVHETEHLKGGSETDARLAEQRFFRNLIAHGHVSSEDGLRYLTLLRDQPREDSRR